MGGGGSYYDRDVTDRSLRTARGYSSFASQTVSRTSASPKTAPLNRRFRLTCASPLVYAFDVTGSMGDLPLIICDKLPMIAGQLAMQKYLDDPLVSLAAVGDVFSDTAPLQVCDPTSIKKLDPWLKMLWLERGGGGQHYESYEFLAYFYARCCEMKNARTPIFLFTGDESFRETLPANTLQKHFGGEHPQNVNAADIFRELKKQFCGNVFLIHRYYRDYDLDDEIVKQWSNTLGRECVIKLQNDLAIADVTLGIIAIASGARTLDEYIEDMKSRPLKMGGKTYEPQSRERIVEVRESLELLASTRDPGRKRNNPKTVKDQGKPPTRTQRAKSGPPEKKKLGRI